MSDLYKDLYKVYKDNDEIHSYALKDAVYYFDGLNWEKTNEVLPIITNQDISYQLKLLGDILEYNYSETSNNGVNKYVKLTEYQFSQFDNNYQFYTELNIGNPNMEDKNYCISGNTYKFKPSMGNSIKNSNKFYVNIPNRTANNYYECKDKAVRNNVPYFLIGDVSWNSTSKDFSYVCYIPKKSIESKNITNLINPLKETIDMFNRSGDSLNDYCNPAQENCSQLDNGYLSIYNKGEQLPVPAKDNFLIYTTDTYNNIKGENTLSITDINNLIDKIQPLNDYIDAYDKINDNYTCILKDMSQNFINYVCISGNNSMSYDDVSSNIKSNSTTFNTDVHQLYNLYESLNTNIDNINTDLSTINLICKDREIYLRNLYTDISKNQIELKKILNYSNGGIGRLKDQKYLRDNTIIEINILILIVIFSLFLYSKIK